MDDPAGGLVPALLAIALATLTSAFSGDERGNSASLSVVLRVVSYFLLATALWIGTGGAGLFVAVVVVCAGIIESDFRWYMIPDGSCLVLLAIGYWAAGFDDILPPTLGAILGGGVLLAVRMSFRRLRGFDGLGLGDVKLAGAMGSVLGSQDLMLAITAGAAITALLHFIALRVAPGRVVLVQGVPAAPLGVGLALACGAILSIKGMTPWR